MGRTRRALADFAGRWSVHRQIADHRGGPAGRFEGVAEFAPRVDGLLYREWGQLHLGAAAALHAERSYLWSERAGQIHVDFADGRPFHCFTGEDHGEARHDCAPDTYAVRYDLSAWPLWHSIWRVTGPRKDYTMSTRYTLASDPDVGQKHCNTDEGDPE